MTPPPAATHAAQSAGIAVKRSGNAFVAGALTRALDARAWARFRALVDVVVLYTAASAALFADGADRTLVDSRWIAVIFPLVVLVVIHARPQPHDRLHCSIVETFTHVLGAVSLSAML